MDLTEVHVGSDENASHSPSGTCRRSRDPFSVAQGRQAFHFVPDLVRLASPTTNKASWLRIAQVSKRRLATTVACC